MSDRRLELSADAAALADVQDDEELEAKLRELHLKNGHLQTASATNGKENEDEAKEGEGNCSGSGGGVAAREEAFPEEEWNPHWQSNLKLLKELYPQVPEHELRCFLIFVQGDMKKARERLAACVAWRQQHLPIRKEEVLAPLRQGLFFFRGVDVAGRPVAYFSLQGHDRKKRSIEEHVKAVVYQSEQLKARMGTSDYRIVLFIDRRGANVFNQDLELYKAFFKTFADLYPMKLFRVVLYPATTVTRVLWSMLRPFVHTHVQRRLVLCSQPRDILAYIPKAQLLADFGGDDDYDFREDL